MQTRMTAGGNDNFDAARKLLGQQIKEKQGRAADQLRAAATEGLGMPVAQTGAMDDQQQP